MASGGEKKQMLAKLTVVSGIVSLSMFPWTAMDQGHDLRVGVCKARVSSMDGSSVVWSELNSLTLSRHDRGKA